MQSSSFEVLAYAWKLLYDQLLMILQIQLAPGFSFYEVLSKIVLFRWVPVQLQNYY